MRLACAVAVLLIGCSGAYAENFRVGRAPLFLLNRRFPLSAYIATAPKTPHTIAILWEAPHRTVRNLRVVLRRTQVREVQIVLFNETCVRNRVCERHESLSSYTQATLGAAIARGDKALRVIIKGQARAALEALGPGIGAREVMINPFLETKLRPAAWNRAARWVTAEVGEVKLVWNPLNNNDNRRPSQAYYTERHGFDVSCPRDGRTIANLDGSRGSSKEVQDWLHRTRSCRLALIWVPADNCRTQNETTFIAPSSRICLAAFENAGG